MKKNINLAVTLLLGIGTSQAQISKTISGLHHVESVATNGKFIFAADIGKSMAPTARDGDGQILKMDKKGNTVDAAFCKEKLNAPKGLAVSKDILLATDIDRVVALDINSGQKLYEIDLSKDSGFLNDIAVWDSNTIFVSATDKNKLFKINLTDKTYTEVATDYTIAGINGLFCYKKASRLYVNGFGSDNQPNGVIGYVDLNNNKFTRLTGLEGYFDGIFVDKDVLYVSNWVAVEKKGVIMAISLFNNRIAKLKSIDSIAGPADFYISNDRMVLPAMLSGEIHFIDIDGTLSLKL